MKLINPIIAGSENRGIIRFCEENKINWYYASKIMPQKAAKAENFIHYLRHNMGKMLEEKRRMMPVTAAKNVTAIYNSNPHSVTGLAPTLVMSNRDLWGTVLFNTRQASD